MAAEIQATLPTPTPEEITKWLRQQEDQGKTLLEIAQGWHPTDRIVSEGQPEDPIVYGRGRRVTGKPTGNHQGFNGSSSTVA